jgi:hypothetical protein
MQRGFHVQLHIHGDGDPDLCFHGVLGSGVQATRVHVALGTGDEEAARLVEHIQAREVEIAAIHDVEGARLGQQLHRRISRTKLGPREHRQPQIDGRGIERVHRVVQLHTEAVAGIQGTRPNNQYETV